MRGEKLSRSMPIHEDASIALYAWILEAGFTTPEMSDQPLFCRQRTNKRLTRAQAWVILKAAARLAGLDVARIAGHSMQKTFASQMWRSSHIGGDMAKMARLLGHRNFSNTLRCLKFLDGSLEKAVLSA